VPRKPIRGDRVALERALSKLGHASRSQARSLIASGKVTVNGRTIRDPLALVHPEHARIQIEGVSASSAPWTLIAFNKPRHVVTTRHDPEGRPTIYDFLAAVDVRVVPVGRLDYASSGLLLLTNDTQFANWLTDPANTIVRRYLVTVRGELSPEIALTLEGGVVDLGERLEAASIAILKSSKRETHLVVELTEGKNREIRRMMKAVGHEVTRLKRVAFGTLELGGLGPGKWREISRQEAWSAFPGARMRSETGGEARHNRNHNEQLCRSGEKRS
jgi:23S rRNA pseudouridine2605 synthase